MLQFCAQHWLRLSSYWEPAGGSKGDKQTPGWRRAESRSGGAMRREPTDKSPGGSGTKPCSNSNWTWWVFRLNVVREAHWTSELKSVLWTPKSLLKYFKWARQHPKHIATHRPCFISLTNTHLKWSCSLCHFYCLPQEGAGFPRTSFVCHCSPA